MPSAKAHPCGAGGTGKRIDRAPGVSTDGSRELGRLRTFYVGTPGHGDLRAAFVIDGRNYTDPEAVRADIAAAVHELHRRRMAAQFFTTPVSPDNPRPGLPDWQTWARRTPGQVNRR